MGFARTGDPPAHVEIGEQMRQKGRNEMTTITPRRLRRTLAVAALAAAFASPVLAQQPPAAQGAPAPGMPMQQGMSMTSPGDEAGPSTKAFKAANDKIMKDMNRPMSGDADQDFVAGMLPHHQGAVEMAKVELQYGKDPEMMRLARNIIAAQEMKIAQMRAWQSKHPSRP